MTQRPLPGTLRATLAVFEHDGTPLTTAEVAEELDVSRRSSYDRLDRLVDRGELATKKVGARGRVWWLPERSGEEPTAVEGTARAGTTAEPPDLGPDERTALDRDLERYRTIVETVNDGIYVTRDGTFTMVNDEYAAMTGYDREELLGSDVSLVVDDATAATARDVEGELAGGERTTARFEADLQRRDGTTRRAEATFTLLTDGQGDSSDGSAESRSGDQPATGDEASAGGGTAGGGERSIERVGVVRDVTERVERERALAEQRERLAVLDDLNAVVREITTDVIERSTRDDIERTLCERLAAVDSYEFAWIGDVDAERQTVEHRIGAGAGGTLDGLTVPVSDRPGRDEPIVRAVRRMEMQVADDVSGDPALRPVQGSSPHRDAGPVAAIPIEHGGNCYGVLTLAAARDAAFTAEERTVVAQLGTIVGHAIAALERKRALMSEAVVELEFRLADVSSVLGIDLPADGQLSLHRAVPIGDEAFLVYGTANPAGLDAARAITDELDHWEELHVTETTGDASRLQLRLSEPPVLAAVAHRGGRIRDFVLEDDEVYMCVHVPPGTRVRALIDDVRSTYPAMEMRSRRQIDRGSVVDAGVRRAGVDDLTQRQLAVLEAAIGMGFFERPRRNSGEQVAEALGITPATFHQHLRIAQRRLIYAALDEPAV